MLNGNTKKNKYTEPQDTIGEEEFKIGGERKRFLYGTKGLQVSVFQVVAMNK